ncbi:hypothetical protein ABVB69_38335, partial [Streptomyces sp. NPDC000349]|uniref:hypothetical protein n=1 Tax=Streptomyces sp. NPDC000349 TaxID=3154249 RepID=UPI00336A8467
MDRVDEPWNRLTPLGQLLNTMSWSRASRGQHLRPRQSAGTYDLARHLFNTLSQWTLSPFLVAASSGLGEEALAGEASEAAAG